MNPGSSNIGENFFAGNGDDANGVAVGSELFKVNSDGEVELVADIASGVSSSSPSDLTVFNGLLYFTTFDSVSSSRILQRLENDGTVTQVAAAPTGVDDLVVAGGSLYFTGTPNTGTAGLYRLDNGGAVSEVAQAVGLDAVSNPDDFTVFQNQLLFSADAASTGNELFGIDASGEIALISDIYNGTDGSSPDEFLSTANGLYFSARGSNGDELHRMNPDGSVEEVLDINPGTGNSAPRNLVEHNGEVFFSADGHADTNGAAGVGPDVGRELFKVASDGSVQLVTDINSGTGNGSPDDFFEHDGTLYFNAVDGVTGRELYRLDGSGQAELVADIRPNASNSEPDEFGSFNGELYFQAADGSGARLFKLAADGTVSALTDETGGFFTASGNPDFTAFGGGAASAETSVDTLLADAGITSSSAETKQREFDTSVEYAVFNPEEEDYSAWLSGSQFEIA